VQTFWRRLTRMRRSELVFVLVALLVVCTLIFAGLAGTIVDSLDDDGSSPDEGIANPDEDLVASLRETIEDNPNDTVTMALLANVLANSGNLDGAIDWYERVLELNPNDVTTRLDFAQSLANGGKRADAEVQYVKVITAQPDNADAHFYLADLYQYWDPPRIEEAAREYQRVIELKPDSFLADQSRLQLSALGYATPVANGTPQGIATPATPVLKGTP
jgi:tetratricopeptide (TPR) repeat protein